MEIDLTLVGQILTVALGMVAAYGAKYLVNLESLIRELGESFTATSKAIDDGAVTKEELVLLIKEWKDVLRILKVLK